MIVLESRHSHWTVLIQSWDLVSVHSQNATDLIQVVNFSSLMQVFYHQVASSLLASSSCIQFVKIRLDASCFNNLHQACG